MASFNGFSSLVVRPCFIMAAVVSCLLFALPMMTKAMPMKDMVGTSVMGARTQQQQQQQQQQQHQQQDRADQEKERQKRSVPDTNCTRPTNVTLMFEQINSQLSNAEFLRNVYNTSASIPAGEDPNVNKTCPSSLTTDSSAPLAHRSLCPYYIQAVVLPEGYYPASLPSAVCKCVKCVQHNAYGCETVQTRIAVLKPVGCFQGLQRYEEQMYELNTGCVCATPGTVQSATTSAPISTTSPWWVD